MIERVNPKHPDKVADRIAGAIVDLAYKENDNPKVAVEVLIGHEVCHVIIEAAAVLHQETIKRIIHRIAGSVKTDIVIVPQDISLIINQARGLRCGDNGIFKGVPIDSEVKTLSKIAKKIYKEFPTDGKYILDEKRGELIVCQSNCRELPDLTSFGDLSIKFNPLGFWTGGINVDTGATNRKLGSDMGRAVTGGGLHGKDLSKADVSVNIMCHIMAQVTGKEVEARCAIGDEYVEFFYDDDSGKEAREVHKYSYVVDTARDYIKAIGGFERFAEWGLI